MDLSEIESVVYDAVDEIQGMKRDSGQVPDFALIFEVCNFLRPELPQGFESDVMGALRSLYCRGMIEYHQNVNGVPMFGVKQIKDEEDKSI